MGCQVIIHSWTFCGLVGAFLDLAIAYLLLCCSTVAFFIGKCLAAFGLSLPCPCNGLFGYPYRGPCLQRVLVEGPTETVSSVQLSVKSKFPFDAILARNDHCQLNLKLVRERRLDDGGVELDGEASYSSFSDPRRSQHSFSGSDSVGGKIVDVKGKGTASQRLRCGVRRRRRGSIDYGKLSSGSYYDHVRSDVQLIHRLPSDSSKIGGELNAQSFHDVQDTPIIQGRSVPDFEGSDATVENKYDNATSSKNLKNNVRHEHGFDSQDDRILEQALEEEQAARAALYSELEQERIAAATAADEAMAMISRLQEEKASVEIEARQYQRILEEKSAYDAEEMDLLKEIIVRREREKHFLEKEVESYRKVLLENEGSGSLVDDTQGHNEASFLSSSVDPILMLQQLSESIDKRGNVHNKSGCPDYASGSIAKQTSTVSLGKESSFSECDDDSKFVSRLDKPQHSSIIQEHLHNGDGTNQDVQEKVMLSMDDILCPQLSRNSSPHHDLHEDVAVRVGEQGVNDKPQQLTDHDEEMQMEASGAHVHDVHTVDLICNMSTEKRIAPLLTHDNASNVAGKCEKPFETSNFQGVEDPANNRLKAEFDINRSCSDIVDRFPSLSSSPSRSLISELRRNSLPAVDHERLKIDSEIGWLRARLRAVQEEKEKLKASAEYREKGKMELQLLEDIATQLREIRHLREPEKAAREPSLPPLSSKGTSKKRRSRSISVGVGQSAST